MLDCIYFYMTKVVATEVNRALLSHSIFTSPSLIDAVASHAAQYRLLKDTLLVHQKRSACLTTQSCLLARAAALQILLLACMVFNTNTICLTHAGLSLEWKSLYAHFKQTYCSNYLQQLSSTSMPRRYDHLHSLSHRPVVHGRHTSHHIRRP
jgi:hypothetical protein